MKRIIIFIVSVVLSCGAMMAQVQQGYVRTKGRPKQPGKPLAGVVIRIKGSLNAVVTDKNGRFSINLPGKRDGDPIVFASIQKSEYQMQDPTFIKRQHVYSSKVPLQIVMASNKELSSDKARIEKVSVKVADKNYKKKLAEIEKQKKKELITLQQYEKELDQLEKKYEKYKALVGDMAERYARTDYDVLDSIDREINICIEKGQLDKADSLILSVFDPTTVVQRNRAAKEEVRQKLEIAQQMYDKAMADKNRLLKDAEYAVQLADKYEFIAAEYRKRGNTGRALECYGKVLEVKTILFDEQSEEVVRIKNIINEIKNPTQKDGNL